MTDSCGGRATNVQLSVSGFCLLNQHASHHPCAANPSVHIKALQPTYKHDQKCARPITLAFDNRSFKYLLLVIKCAWKMILISLMRHLHKFSGTPTFKNFVIRLGSKLIAFLPHDAIVARYMLSLCVCPFVCLSVTSRSSTKMSKPRIMQTTPYRRSQRNSSGFTHNRSAKQRWGGSKVVIFNQYFAVSQKWCNIRTQQLQKANQNLYA